MLRALLFGRGAALGRNRGKQIKAMPVTGCGDPKAYETSRLPQFIENRLTDGGKVSLTSRPPCASREIPGTQLCWRLSRPQEP
jgi:hypothetical protein